MGLFVEDTDIVGRWETTYGYDVHVIQGVLGEVEVSSYWGVSIITGVKSVVYESLSECFRCLTYILFVALNACDEAGDIVRVTREALF